MKISLDFSYLKLFLLLTILLTSSCKMQVVYKERNEATDVSLEKEMSAIRIKKTRTRVDQQLKNNLYDLLNPDYINSEPKYFLSLTITKTISSTFITATGASGRNRVTMTVSYALKDLSTAQDISSGSTMVTDNYDVTANRYGTYTSDDFVQMNLVRSAAQNIRNLLVNDFIEMKRKKEAEKDEAAEVAKTDVKNPKKIRK